ncbi:ABC transporter permease [Propionibacteriaceae bacterium Y1923]|uniref:ABC transporter permease n=1 Tax=Aestuariimicrobium sp. Y1814 TaxID=3418742 RepID=UPI003C2871F7
MSALSFDRAVPTTTGPRTGGRTRLRLPDWTLPLLGIGAAIGVWWLLTDVLFASRPLVAGFSPTLTWTGLVELWRSGSLLDAAASSVFRLLAGLGVAFVFGVVGGIAVGSLGWLDRATRPVQLFLRMVSPLSWAPVAVIAFGVGGLPVVALVAAAAVWPILTATADGVRAVRPAHRQVARALGATGPEVVRHVVLPAIRPNVLAGLRLAMGMGWVVLVPAEMLGVTSGLGYAVLNAKDQLAYHHITALILVIGTIGFALDVVARWAFASPRERRDERAGRFTR